MSRRKEEIQPRRPTHRLRERVCISLRKLREAAGGSDVGLSAKGHGQPFLSARSLGQSRL